MKKLIFALFPFALLFGKTEIRLQTIDYEPFVEEMVAEIELEDGEIVSQTINGKEATEEDFEKLAKETGEQIGFETEIVSLQQNAIAEYVGSFLESKGIEYENHGTKLVVEKLEPEIVAEITAGFSFVESIEEVEEAIPEDYSSIREALMDAWVSALAQYKRPDAIWLGENSIIDDIGVVMMEAKGACFDERLDDINNEFYFQSGRGTYSHSIDYLTYHATKVGHILQKSSQHAFVYCLDKNLSLDISNYSPNIYISNHSYGHNGSSYDTGDKELDNFVYNSRVASFKSSGNILENDSSDKIVTSPGKGLNVITVGNYSSATGNMEKLVWSNPSNGAEKPEFIANGFFDFNGDVKQLQERSGSSYASPFVASGFGANLLAQFGLLKYNPQLLKALLLTMSVNVNDVSKDRYLDNSPITNKEGAGTLDYSLAKNVIRLSTTTSSSAKNMFRNGYYDIYKSYFSYYYTNRKVRVAIAWLVHGDYTMKEDKPYADYDLYIKKDGEIIAKSRSDINTFEVVEFIPPSRGYYTVEVRKRRLDTSHEDYKDAFIFGLAMSHRPKDW
jgi:hypothetical protein